jgi:hypothetical protein
VRGQAGSADEVPVFATAGVDAPDEEVVTLPAAVVAVEEAVAAPSEAGRVHAYAAAQISRNRQEDLVIKL